MDTSSEICYKGKEMKKSGGEGSREGGVCPFLVGETSAHQLMRMIQWRRKQDDGAGVVISHQGSGTKSEVLSPPTPSCKPPGC